MLNRPFILYEGKYTIRDLILIKKKKIWKIKDIYIEQLKELFEVENPSIKFNDNYNTKLNAFIKNKTKNELAGNWIYFPWSGVLLHTVNEKDYLVLRTNRNQLLISSAEQKKLLNSTVGLVGLSIGSHFSTSLVYSGIANNLKLADFDKLSTTNLNRVRARVEDVETHKIEVTSEQLYELNPYINLTCFPQGLNKQNIGDFLNSSPKPAVIFEAIDDFEMKIILRLKAKEAKIPVIMFTNLGDNLLIDIERYDEDSSIVPFNGLIGNTPNEILEKKITEIDKIRYAIKIVELKNTPVRALKTLLEINKTLVGRPQLYSTVTISGGIAAYFARRIILGKSLPSGRKSISFKDLFKFEDDTDDLDREEVIEKIQERLSV